MKGWIFLQEVVNIAKEILGYDQCQNTLLVMGSKLLTEP